MQRLTILFILVVLPLNLVWPGSTGKIAGRVLDAVTKEPLIGVSVMIEGTRLGAATDVDGMYTILIVPPGTYVVRASAIGYHPASMTNVKVSVDLTTKADLELTETTIQLNQEVIVVAQRPIVQRDLTSSSAKVDAEQIKAFPVEDVAGLVNLQAGVVEGHFRGGRSGEVLYLIDGIPVTDAYSGGAGITAENHSILELEVISGTFNAEYGQAMSGVVNQVTKEGSRKFQGSVSVYGGDYVSGRDNLFLDPDSARRGNLTNELYPADTYQKLRPNDIADVQASLSGPLIGEDISFFISGRLYNNEGYLYGRRIFLPTDSTDYSSNDPSRWYRGGTGDNAYVPMNPDKRSTIQGKFTFRVSGANKLQLNLMHQDRTWRSYDHRYKYTPDGAYRNTSTARMASGTMTSTVGEATFLDLHAAWISNRENMFVYEDPYDTLFPVYTRRLSTGGSAFFTGGAEDLHLHRETQTVIGKADLLSQPTQQHQIKMGVEGKWYRVWVNNYGIQNDQSTNYRPQPVYFGRSEFASVVLSPRQFAAYVQDKMEFDDLIVNVGIRVDHFDSQARILTDQLTLSRPKQTKAAPFEFQASPRFGLAFPITDRGVLHLSYGHFFQIPSFDLLFLNPSYNINATESFQVGNPGLRSERTVAYELGLQQQLTDDIGLDATVYSKDVRNLIGTQIFDIGNGNKYSQYVNQDYGTTRGFILSFEKRMGDGFGASLDYTFQIAKGNASDPNSVFLDNQTDPPRESQHQLAPLDWDRRHSLNLSMTWGNSQDYTVTLITRLGSGLPYTPALQNQRTGLLNSENRPMVFTADIYATKSIPLQGAQINVFAKVYNVFDSENELDVFTDTGRANYSLQSGYSGRPRGVNSIKEFYTRPDFYSAPRQVIIGFEVSL
ncbi:MAG: hypothetical protein A3H45_13900 [Ignavibacteria bacterium RIFCSPLOWO2_02_FULL_55_14]|nr:MAG: hypothetical protein A3G43_07935 [Ignavibacteria bacterium RIFCSPLOWO2_12_FULL_56_21]OGU73791.1 MAG: hypothetical protein A3H45_13900 [Ignavibacteria bacterium RIFCSPLOWO2_02_FULL_55_14]